MRRKPADSADSPPAVSADGLRECGDPVQQEADSNAAPEPRHALSSERVLLAVWIVLWMLVSVSPAGDIGLILDEDFTDGVFDDTNAVTGDASGPNWRPYGPGSALRPATNRSFAHSLSNLISAGGGSFADGANWSIWRDADLDLVRDAAELQSFRMHKTDEVVVLKFTAYSDVARSSSVFYNVEVAMLENDDALAGSPHFGHDLSFEAAEAFSTSAGDQVQLVPNVENLENRVTAVRQSHHSGVATSATLAGDWQNLVIWRNRPGTGTTNIEQWGENLSGDYTVASEMNDSFPPSDPDYAAFNEIRFTFQRGAVAGAPTLIRGGVSLADAQIGITHVHVGITTRTDFNLDYGHTIDDYFVMAAGWGVGGRTLLRGDGDNDGDTDADDWELLKANWGVGAPVAVVRYPADAPALSPSTDLIAEVNGLTGEVRLAGASVPIIGYKLASPGGGLVTGAAQHLWHATHAGNPLHRSTAAEVSDLDVAGSVVSSVSLGTVYATEQALQDLTFVWQSAAGQPTRSGVVVYDCDADTCTRCPGNLRGDFQPDCVLSGDDIQGFVDCLAGGGTSCACADVNADAALDDADLLMFVDQLLAGAACS